MGAITSKYLEHNYICSGAEKDKITTFNKLEYTPVIGSAIGSVKIVYGVLKMALEVIKGIGNFFCKNNEYNFIKEFNKGLCSFERGLCVLLLPVYGGWLIYQLDKSDVCRYNYNNAEALLNIDDMTEKDINMAYEFAKKLPYKSNNQLNWLRQRGVGIGDPSDSYGWALKRRSLMIQIQSKCNILNLHAKADTISEVQEEELRKNAQQQKQLRREEAGRQRDLEEMKQRQAEVEKNKEANCIRARMLRATIPT